MVPNLERICWLHETSLEDRERIGSKAARLGQIVRAGFQVPPGFCLPESAYRRHVIDASPAHFHALLKRQDYSALRAWILEREIDPEVRRVILDEYRRLQENMPAGLPVVGVAVRSSSTAEDLEQHSFAGLYSSFLHVNSEARLFDAVRECWASYWNDEAAAYRERAGMIQTRHGMAVIVQAMIPAVLGGVLYTQTSKKEPDVALIEFTRGGGEALVSGEARAEKIFVRRSGRPVRAGKTDLELDVSRLVSLGRQLEVMLGAPQDVEWVMDAAGMTWILQTRPVTKSLDGQAAPENGGAALKKGTGPGSVAAGEGQPGSEWMLTYDEPFSPLGCEIAMRRYHYWVRAINASFKTRFQPVIQNRDGLLYYRPDWYRASLPVKIWMNLWRLAAWINSSRIHREYVNEILPAYTRGLQQIEQQDLAELDGSMLIQLLREAVRLYLEFQFTSYAVGAAATLSAGLLNRACRFLFGKGSRRDAMDFLTGIDDVSIQRELKVYRLGQLLRPSLPQDGGPLAQQAGLEGIRELVGPDSPFWPALQEFLNQYGYLWADRYPRDPAWELNQEALAASLWIAAQASPDESLEARHQKQKLRRNETVRAALEELSKPGGLPLKKHIFTVLLKRAERLFPYKESRNHYTYKGMMAIRQIAREIGLRMENRRLLPSAGDLFFLELDEIEMLWENAKVASWLVQKVEKRKEIYHSSRSRILRRAGRAMDQAGQAAVKTLEVQGDPCSPGLARGPARLVSGPGELHRVQPGEILVCTQLRPAWSAVFSRAGGVVIEMGSLLSHGSALAREYGIPAVINVSGITGLVHENDWLVVDGNLGLVSIERNHTLPQEDKES
ncbi:MAG: hypothetical protein GX491_15645 [Chloroflexi bacterium]|nr:hypothetical protein [Chloroflexota bacterium]